MSIENSLSLSVPAGYRASEAEMERERKRDSERERAHYPPNPGKG